MASGRHGSVLGEEELEQEGGVGRGYQDNRSATIEGQDVRQRITLSEHDHAAFASREMDHLGTALEVDHMILDFLLFQATEACLQSRRPDAEGVQHLDTQACISQADQFLLLFKSRYPAYQPDPELHFRQKLLQLVVLVTQRYQRCFATPAGSSLEALRTENHARARRWIGDVSRLPTVDNNVKPFDDALPLPTQDLGDNRSRVLKAMGVPAEDGAYEDSFYGTSECVSLLEILPLFMRVSAACNSMWECPPTEKWMKLAAEWMLQASLEQYLVFGASGSDPIDEAFAWGPVNPVNVLSDNEENVTEHAAELGDPFSLGMDDEIFDVWNTIKAHALRTILSPEKQYWKDLASHLAALGYTHPLAIFEHDVLQFLGPLAESIDEPVLTQLQKGQLKGMTRSQTQSFVRSCGIDVAEIFATIDQPG